MPQRHDVVVEYTTDDDGIWVTCRTCNWRSQVVGDEFWPRPEQLLVLANFHQAEVR